MSTDLAKKPAKTAVSNLTLGSADDALTLAKELQKFVKDNKLTSNIQGKEFPNVEAWQFAGSLLGLTSMLESIEDKSVDTLIKWQATVTIHNVHTGAVVGRGFATCDNKESTKKFFADYAICSMAQTRAVGKAYRLFAGWLMKAAGYEATPLEEMEERAVEPETSATVAMATDEQKSELRRLLNSEFITPGECESGLANLHTMSADKAEKSRKALDKLILERSAQMDDDSAAYHAQQEEEAHIADQQAQQEAGE